MKSCLASLVKSSLFSSPGVASSWSLLESNLVAQSQYDMSATASLAGAAEQFLRKEPWAGKFLESYL